MSELRERLIAAAMGVPLPFVAEFKSGREQELVAALGEEGAAKVVDALLALPDDGIGVVERERAAAILFEALQLTGKDTSGYDGWAHWMGVRALPDLAREVREAVRELRDDYEEERR